MAAAPMLYIIDDSNYPVLNYTGDWTERNSTGSFDNTITGTETAGSSVTFLFNGTFVSVYGEVNTSGNNAQYYLDDVAQPVAPIPPPSKPLYQQALYSSPVLEFNQHNLTVVAVDNRTSLLLDYFKLTGEAPMPKGHHGGPSSDANSTPSPSPVASHHSLPAGAIAGIVIGVVVAVAIIAALLYFWFRDRFLVISRPKKQNIVEIAEDPDPIPMKRLSKSFLRDLVLARFNVPVSHAPSDESYTSRGGQSSAMFTSVIILTPPVSTVAGSSSTGTRTIVSAPSRAGR